MFKETVHRIINWIKNKPYFRWPKKMGGDPSRRNHNLYCTYHRDKGAYHQVVPDVKGPFKAISEGGISEGVCGKFRGQGHQERCSAKREPSPSSIGSD